MLRLLCALCLVAISGVLSQGDVRLPPTIIQSPTTEVIYRMDERIKLECRAVGAGTLTYEWIKNKVTMNLNVADLEVEENGAVVIIKHASRLSEGFYQCFVSSAYGKVLSNTSFLHLATVGEPSSKEIMVKLPLEGQPFIISASPQKSFPKPIYNWEIITDIDDATPQKLQLNKRIQVDENGDLHFAYALPEDSIDGKIYKLVTFNQYLDQRLGGSYTKVDVRRAPNGPELFSPTIAFPNTVSYVAVVGRDITLRCFFSANPVATYSWTAANPRRIITPTSEGTELNIREIQQVDEGNYVCEASNTKGRAKQTMQIDVQSAPAFRSVADKPRNVNVTEGEAVTFNCNAEAEPATSVTWYKDGEILDAKNIQRRMRFSHDMKSLTIDKVCRDCLAAEDGRSTDLMVIQCNSSNKHGYALGSGYLNVLMKTEVASVSEENEIYVKEHEVRTVHFQCTAKSDPSTPVAIEWRKVRPNEPQLDDRVYPSKILTVNDGVLTITIEQNTTDKWQEVQGDYRCVANNSYSWDSKTMKLYLENYVLPVKPAEFPWWIIVIIAILLLLLILLLCCCLYCQRNKGDSYPVDEKERKNGNDPEKEIQDNDFQDYKRPEGRPLRGSRGSLGSSSKLNSDDEGSLNEYGDVDPGKFTEDGSFVGVYTNTADRKRGRNES